MAKNDDNDIWDDDFSFDDFDDDLFGESSFKSSNKQSGRRKAVTDFAGGFVSGIKGSILSRSVQRNFIEKALPKGYTTAYDAGEYAYDSTKDLYDTAKHEGGNLSNSAKKKLKDALPKIDKHLPPAVKARLKDWSDSYYEYDYKPKSRQQEEADEITSTLSSLFGQIQETDKRKEIYKEVKAAAEKNIDRRLDLAGNDHLAAIRHLTSRQVSYQDKVTSSYQRKQIELGYKQYFVQAQLLDSTKQFMEMSKTAYEAITKNTGLPDAVKLQNSEMFAVQMKQRFIKSAQDNILSNYRQIGNKMRSNAKASIREKFAGLGDNLESLEGLINAGAEYGENIPAEMRRRMAMQGAGEFAGGGLSSLAANFIAKKLGKRLEGNAKLGMFGNMATSAVGRSSRFFNDITDGRGSGNLMLDQLMDMLGLDQIRDNKNRVIQTSSLESLGDQTYFDMHTKLSITKVIPGWLAKIYQVGKAILTGESEAPPVFDFESGGFKTRSEINSRMDKTLVGERKEDANSRIREALNAIDPDNKIKGKARRELGKYITRQVMNSGDVNIWKLAKSDLNDVSSDPAVVAEISSVIRETFEIDDEIDYNDTEYLGQIKGSFSRNAKLQKAQAKLSPTLDNLFHSVGNPLQRMESYARMGMLDELKDNGLVNSTSSGRHSLNLEEYIERIVNNNLDNGRDSTGGGSYSAPGGDGFVGPHFRKETMGEKGKRYFDATKKTWYTIDSTGKRIAESGKDMGARFSPIAKAFGYMGGGMMGKGFDKARQAGGEMYDRYSPYMQAGGYMAGGMASKGMDKAKAMYGQYSPYVQAGGYMAGGMMGKSFDKAKATYGQYSPYMQAGGYMAGGMIGNAAHKGMNKLKDDLQNFKFKELSKESQSQLKGFGVNLKGAYNKGTEAAILTRTMEAVGKTAQLIEERIPKPKSFRYNDRDRDGDRDGSVADQLQNRKAAETFKGSVTEITKQGGEVAGSFLNRLFGSLPGGALLAAAIPAIVSMTVGQMLPSFLGDDNPLARGAKANPLLAGAGVYGAYRLLKGGAGMATAKAGQMAAKSGLMSKLGWLGKLVPKSKMGIIMSALGLLGLWSSRASAGETDSYGADSGNGLPTADTDISDLPADGSGGGGGWGSTAAMLGLSLLPAGKIFGKAKGGIGKLLGKGAAGAGSKLPGTGGFAGNTFNYVGRGAAAAGNAARGPLASTARAHGLRGASALNRIGSAGRFVGSMGLRALPLLGSAAMGIGGALGTAAAVITSPVTLTLAGVALAAGGGYLLYKGLKLDESALVKLRMVQYGYRLKDEAHVSKILEMESMLLKYVKYGQDGSAIIGNGLNVGSILKGFGVSVDDEESLTKWLLWFQDRFKPIFLTHVTAMKRVAGKVDLINVDTILSKTQYENYLSMVKWGGQTTPYQQMVSPFAGESGVDTDWRDVKKAYSHALKAASKVKDSKATEFVENVRRDSRGRVIEDSEPKGVNSLEDKVNSDDGAVKEVIKTTSRSSRGQGAGGKSGGASSGIWDKISNVFTGGAGSSTGYSGRNNNGTLKLTAQDLRDLAKVTSTEVAHYLPAMQRKRQAAAVIDTIMNRVMSGKFKDTIREVINQHRQFSKITGPANLNPYGSVQKMPDSDVQKWVWGFVTNYVKKRAEGVQSIVFDHLHYVNPIHITENNRVWVTPLVREATAEGLVFGSGQSRHYHGTTAAFKKYRPGNFKISLGGSAGAVPVKTRGQDTINGVESITDVVAEPAKDKRRRGKPTSGGTGYQPTAINSTAPRMRGTAGVASGTTSVPMDIKSKKYDPGLIALGKKATILADKGVNMNGLKDFFRNAFYAMVGEYNKLTGGKIQVNSAHRTYAEQKVLYDNYTSGRSKTVAAPPGGSRHNHGVAIDVQTPHVNKLIEHGLLKKYGFHRPLLAKLGETWHLELVGVTPGVSVEPDKALKQLKKNEKKPVTYQPRSLETRTAGELDKGNTVLDKALELNGAPKMPTVKERVDATLSVDPSVSRDSAIIAERRKAVENEAVAQVRQDLMAKENIASVKNNENILNEQLAMAKSMDMRLDNIYKVLEKLANRPTSVAPTSGNTNNSGSSNTTAAASTASDSSRPPIDMRVTV